MKVRNNGCFQDLRFGLIAFLLFLFTYRGEVSSFMQKSQVFFVEFRKHCVEVRKNGCCRDLRAIELAYECPETGFFCGNFVAVAKIRKNPVSLAILRKS